MLLKLIKIAALTFTLLTFFVFALGALWAIFLQQIEAVIFLTLATVIFYGLFQLEINHF